MHSLMHAQQLSWNRSIIQVFFILLIHVSDFCIFEIRIRKRNRTLGRNMNLNKMLAQCQSLLRAGYDSIETSGLEWLKVSVFLRS